MVSKKDRHGNIFTVVQILRVSADTESVGGALCWGPGVDSNAIDKDTSRGKLQQNGQNLGRVFNSRLGRACICCATVYITKQPNLQLKNLLKQLSDSLLLAFALPALAVACTINM